MPFPWSHCLIHKFKKNENFSKKNSKSSINNNNHNNMQLSRNGPR